MIKHILDLLRLQQFYNTSENIEIAKGKNEIPLTWVKGFEQIKRQYKWKKKQ